MDALALAIGDGAASPAAPRGWRSSTCQRAGRRGRARIVWHPRPVIPARQRATYEGTGTGWTRSGSSCCRWGRTWSASAGARRARRTGSSACSRWRGWSRARASRTSRSLPGCWRGAGSTCTSPSSAAGRCGGGWSHVASAMGIADRVEFPGFVPGANPTGSTAVTTRSCSRAGRRATGASSSASRCSRRWRAGCRCWSATPARSRRWRGGPSRWCGRATAVASPTRWRSWPATRGLGAERGAWNRQHVPERYDQRKVRQQLGGLYRDVLAG